MEKPVLALSGGGTGGHFYPMLAFARYVKKQKLFSELFFVGDRKGIEGKREELLKGVFERYLLLKMGKFKGKNLLGLTATAVRTFGVAAKIAPYLKGKNFLSLTFGGYTAAPLALYTRLAKKPLFIHEQNSIPGMGNRILARFAKRVFISFPSSERFFPKGKTVLTGIPLREEVKKYKNTGRKEILSSLEWEDKFNLLILGGSLGARSLNLLAVELSEKLPQGVRLIHITGKGNYERVKELYREKKRHCEVVLFPYFEEMGKLLRIADFAISRAGASTAAELAFFGVPTLFVPYPYAAYDHQYYNALYYADGGGAYVMREEELSPQRVLEIVTDHYRDPQLKTQMGERMEKLFIPDAEKKILEYLKGEF